MREKAKRWLAKQFKEKCVSAEVMAEVLGIPVGRLHVGSGEVLEADDFLRVCAYLHIRPEDIPMDDRG